MTLKKCTLIMTFLVSGMFNFIFSQALNSAQNLNLSLLKNEVVSSSKINATGSPYINEDFTPIKIKDYGNNVYTGRYNGYNGQLEVNLGSKIIALKLSSKYEVTFTQTNKVYRTYSYLTQSGISKNGFLVVINENEDHSLLKLESVKYFPKEAPQTSYESETPAKFKREKDSYFYKNGPAVIPLPTKKKDLLKAFSKHAKALKGFLKENKLSLKKEQDLIKIAEHIATL